MFEADLQVEAEWMRAEMRYGHAKTHGYPEKLRRLRTPQMSSDSVLSFMSRYWDAFQKFNDQVEPGCNPISVQLALQQLGKVPNGLVDKVGLMLWLQDNSQERYIDAAVDLVLNKALEGSPLPHSVYGKILKTPTLGATSLGWGINELHLLVVRDESPAVVLDSAVNNAVNGMYTWATYLHQLREQTIDVTLPRPGMPSGIIEPWEFLQNN